ncbi:MAG: hypothetical protein Q8N15_05050 [Bacillota bacterium]|nr:hypothetical protein [Bacillota bacterium]
MRAIMLWSLCAFCLFLTGCLSVTTVQTTVATTTSMATSQVTTSITTTTAVTTILTTFSTNEYGFDYLGETPPIGSTAIRFDPPGLVANSVWFYHSVPVFSPDGTEMYWSKYLVSSDQIEIWYTRKVEGRWSTATRLDIEGITGHLNNPIFMAGDDGLFFVNIVGGIFAIYRVTRTVSGWGNPIMVDLPIPEGYSLGWDFSIADNGNMYFPLSSNDLPDVSSIYVSEYHDGVYQIPTMIANQGTGLYGNFAPEIAPDESYLFFTSRRDEGYGYHDMYISFRSGDGIFSEPINMGTQINTADEDGRAGISEDGIYLFFTTAKAGDRGFNPYWIRIDQLDVFNDR